MSIVDDMIGRVDWSAARTYAGFGEMLPAALRDLATGSDRSAALRIELVLLTTAGPREACLPVATVLVAALPEMTAEGRAGALDLLAQIGAAEVTGPPHEQIGVFDMDEIRRAVAVGFPFYVSLLRDAAEPEIYSCVDLVGICGWADPALVPAALAALRAVPTTGRHPDLAILIENTVEDLTHGG